MEERCRTVSKVYINKSLYHQSIIIRTQPYVCIRTFNAHSMHAHLDIMKQLVQHLDYHDNLRNEVRESFVKMIEVVHHFAKEVEASIPKAPPLPPLPPLPPSLSNRKLAVVAFDYPGGHRDDELILKSGQKLEILDNSEGPDGWWKGLLGEKTGWFPASYVRRLKA